MRILLIVLITSMLQAQAAHSITLSWTDPIGGYPTGVTYSVYRAVGVCNGIPAFVKPPLASGLAVKTFIDSTVSVGSYCYVVTATVGGVESPPSLSAGATVAIGTVSINGIAVQ